VNITKNDILIAVTGLTPQVITETIYYFYKIRKPPIKIKEVYTITTVEGKKRIVDTLFNKGIFKKLCERLDRNIKFDENSIYLLTDNKGRALEDIRTISDNERVAEKIWEVVKEHTSREQVNVHCSVAGGRKTMGVYAALVMSLLGREGDTLSHILVDEGKESSDFFFPITKEDEAKLSLAEIPYIRLRDALKITEKKLNFVQRIRAYQKELDTRLVPEEIELNFEDRILNAGKNGKVSFSEREFFIYSLLAEKRKQCLCENGCNKCFLDVSTIVQEIPQFLERFKRYFTQPKTIENMTKIDEQKRKNERIYEIMTRINTKIEKEDICKKDFFKIQKIGKRPDSRYGLKISLHKIKFLL
jgi:CRISPR-associated protein (TIGR02584 family)